MNGTVRYAVDKLVGFSYNGNEFIYRRNIQGDITHIYDINGVLKAQYIYDAYGNHVVLDVNGNEATNTNSVGNLNPFRYRGYYYDQETELYYLNSRYYDPEIGRFFSPDTLSILDETRSQINGLNLYMYCGDNPIMRVDPSGMAWWNWLLSIGQIVVGTILCATGVGVGLGASLIIGGSIGVVMQLVSPAIAQIVGGLGSIANGWGALSTAISLFTLGPIGIVAGIVLGAVGLATMAFGVNDVVAGATGTNYIQKWSGMSDSAYGWINIGLNIASGLGRVVANKFMNSNFGQRTYAYHNVKKFEMTNTVQNHIEKRPYTTDVKLMKKIIKNGKMTRYIPRTSSKFYSTPNHMFTYNKYEITVNNVWKAIMHFLYRNH